MFFVLDCSVGISWCLQDEDNTYANAVYNILSGENQAIVPAFFGLEISNVLWVAERKKRNTREQSDAAIAMPQALPINVDAIAVTETITATLNLARQYNLAVYDAAYLELAIRAGILLATIDDRLAHAAQNLGILLEDPDLE
ncbi:type II toxin-antitoxin system VapC family toxin [Chlorogloeopsis fritschii PCC 9212]|uniref:Ribonuclease VapC n=1 Tax=Chlorogloeopsis fritschii PCC 6912 TaxID=211165 RepID=A0A3S1AKN0_CHLFR|nr:type II toxin-antitoxin system VapC family toxin [Chlorogloeopsis fritschii]RUR83041.1 ribonuclease VapC [Chlorogloeopsis fritschii PCC 6912]